MATAEKNAFPPHDPSHVEITPQEGTWQADSHRMGRHFFGPPPSESSQDTFSAEVDIKGDPNEGVPPLYKIVDHMGNL